MITYRHIALAAVLTLFLAACERVTPSQSVAHSQLQTVSTPTRGSANLRSTIDVGAAHATHILPITHWKIFEILGTEPAHSLAPDVTLSANPSDHTLILRGPGLRVTQLAEALAATDIYSDDDIRTSTRELHHISGPSAAAFLNSLYSPLNEARPTQTVSLLAVGSAKSLKVASYPARIGQAMVILDQLDQPPSTLLKSPPVAWFKFDNNTLDDLQRFMAKSYGTIMIGFNEGGSHFTVDVTQPVSEADAIGIIRVIVVPMGFVIRSAAFESNRTVLIREDNFYDRRTVIPPHFGADASTIADTAELITQVVPLKNLKASFFCGDVGPMRTKDIDYSADDVHNNLVLTGSSATIRRLVNGISKLDAASGTQPATTRRGNP